MSPKDITDAEFDSEVLQSSMPVLVDFWAPWCGPCKALAPVLEEVAAEREGKLKVAKVNIDDNPDSPNRYGVRGIPTMLVFKDGEMVGQRVGATTKKAIDEWIRQSLL
ncbi:MAG: thioredoxin [Alphaproteobacteria bacterium]